MAADVSANSNLDNAKPMTRILRDSVQLLFTQTMAFVLIIEHLHTLE